VFPRARANELFVASRAAEVVAGDSTSLESLAMATRVPESIIGRLNVVEFTLKED
jgi:hypothetical protein